MFPKRSSSVVVPVQAKRKYDDSQLKLKVKAQCSKEDAHADNKKSLKKRKI
jgi:hypothetical protein